MLIEVRKHKLAPKILKKFTEEYFFTRITMNFPRIFGVNVRLIKIFEIFEKNLNQISKISEISKMLLRRKLTLKILKKLMVIYS